MFDIITFGSATWDIFLRPKGFKIIRNKGFISEKGICFNLGSKIDVKDIEFNSGGGGTNTAATFAKQGFKVAYCSVVGKDASSREILDELKRLKIDTSLVKRKKSPTDHSVILDSGEKGDRTIFVYHGASSLLCDKDISWQKLKDLKAKWFYLAPLSGRSAKLTEKIVNFAEKNNIKIALNPGNSQLVLSKNILRRILKKIDILFLNQEEASLLTGINFEKERKILFGIHNLCQGIVVITKGEKGVLVSDNKNIYQSKAKKVKVADRTGAGDSFASGFLSEFIRSHNIEKSIQLGVANASSCLKKVGAKNGLLKKGDKFSKIKVEKK